jgi:hypothetical protein
MEPKEVHVECMNCVMKAVIKSIKARRTRRRRTRRANANRRVNVSGGLKRTLFFLSAPTFSIL